MVGQRIRCEPIFLRERGVRAFTETISLGCFGILANLMPNRKFPLQALDLCARADAVGPAPDRKQVCLASIESSACFRDFAIADVELAQVPFAPYTKRQEK